ncbi:MAG: ABC transporter permease [Planctomycetes bacterium]|nr:ABC transporter permease [Planctomycetota bacterium]
MLPFGYLVRNLLRRPLRSLVTVFGVAATTLLVIAMTAFATGLHRVSGGQARADRVFLLGTANEVDLVRSVLTRGHAEVAAAAAPGVLEQDGQRAASVEIHIATRNGDRIGLLRGVTPAAYLVHPEVTVTAGREPREPFEIMVGALAAARMGLTAVDVALGATLPLERRTFKVVGHFAAPGTIYEAELWGRLTDVMLATRREDVSCVALRLADPAGLPGVRLFAARRVDLELAAVPEVELLAALAVSLRPIAALAQWMALLAVVAGAVACANTMFAAVLARIRELATLRALGHRPWAVGVGLVQESLLVGFLGGAAGLAAAVAIGGWSLRYPMGALQLDADLASRALGLGGALLSGLLGGLAPALRAVRMPLPDALGGRI